MAWKIAGHVSDAAVKELEKIRSKTDGKLIPEMVVEYAHNKNNPLHRYFVWDDSEAARLFRLRQASELIRVCVRIIPGTKTAVRAYVSLTNERKNAPGRSADDEDDGKTVYRRIDDVVSDTAMRKQLLADAMCELAAFRRKYCNLSELASVMKAVDAYLDNVA